MNYLALDFETSYAFNMGYDKRAYPVCLCAISETQSKHWVFNHDSIEPQPTANIVSEIQEMVSSVDIIIAHNAKFDLHWLRRLGVDFSKQKIYCTQVAEYLINGENNRVRYSLAETSLRYGITPKQDVVKEWWDSGYETCEIPLHILIPYCYQDTQNALDIFLLQQPIIQEKGLQKIVTLSCEMCRVLEDIEWNGMMIDTQLCRKYSEEYAEQIETLYNTLHSFVRSNVSDLHDLPETDNQGKPLPNFGSGEQLSAILFGGDFKFKGRIDGVKEGTTKNGTVVLRTTGLGLVPRDGTETANDGYYQTDKAQLTDLKVANKIQRRFLEQLGELSRLEKMRGTYLISFLEKNQEDIIHGNIHQTRTVTGRFSMTDPALQTVPRSSTSSIKEVFISRYEHV
jgi:DNA polymerase I-like protein with 3'-5' exonuclease and polymerase domains